MFIWVVYIGKIILKYFYGIGIRFSLRGEGFLF